MAKLATCPSCTTQLALPEAATLSDRVRCPRCGDKFLLMETVQFSIPEAELLVPDSQEETVAESIDTEDPTPIFSDVESDRFSEPADSTLPAMSATLSDWEARLKRAINTDLDDDTPTKPEAISSFGSRELASEIDASKLLTSPQEDFEVSDSDLYAPPESTLLSRQPWSADEAYHDEPIVEEVASYTEAESAFEQPVNPSALIDVEASSLGFRRPKKKRSLLRTAVSASLGVVGIPLGLYALLWLRGPSGDVLNIARFVPSFMLPSSFSEPKFGGAEEVLVSDPLPQDKGVVIAEADTHEETSIDTPQSQVHDDPAVAPASATESIYRGPKFSLVVADEFSTLLKQAQQVAENLGAGDLKSKESVASKGQGYMALAALAEKCSFLNQPRLTPEETALTQSAKQLFETTFSNEIAKRDLAQIALRWWQYVDRPNSGMIFTGKVERLQDTSAGWLAFLSLGSDPIAPEIPVLFRSAEFQVGEELAIVGNILANPQEQLPDLDANLDSVVIAQHSFTLIQPESTTEH